MDQKDAANFAQWLQEILNTLRDTHTQLEDLRAENRQMMDNLRGIASRVDQKDTDTLKLIESLRVQLDVTKAEVSAAKNAAENASHTLDSKLSDLKSVLSDIRRSI